MANNKPAFIREGGEVYDVTGKHHYLVWNDEFWCIQRDAMFLGGKSGGYFCINTSGKYFFLV